MVLRLAFVVAVLAVLSQRVSWAELRTAFAEIDQRVAVVALALYGPAILALAVRLTLLLRAFAAHFPFRTILMLTFRSNLLNLVLPGGNGGDIYKAVHLARLSGGRGTESVTVLLLDRLIGLGSFVVLAIATIGLSWNEGLGPIGRAIGIVLFTGAGAAIAYTSPAVRRVLRWETQLARLPFAHHLSRIDATLVGLRTDPGTTIQAFGLSMVAQLLGAVVFVLLGFACGVDTSRGLLAFAIPCTLAYAVSTIASAIPITVQGFGVTEAIFYRLLVEQGWCTLPQMLALTLSYRFVAILWALPGAPASLVRTEEAHRAH